MNPHTHFHGDDEPYTHDHVDPECTHRWESCPVHGKPDGELPPFRIVLTCAYGGAELNDGGTWTQATSNEVLDRMFGEL